MMSAKQMSETAQRLYEEAEKAGEATPDSRMAFIAGAGWALQDADRAALADTQLADALTEVIACFDAANSEGLDDALVNNTDSRLTDLVQRRLMYAYYAAIAAAKEQE